MTLDSIQRTAHTDSIPVPLAASHYADGMQRGKRVGRAEMLLEIISTMKSETFHDYVWNNWRNERELYDVMIQYLIENNKQTYRPIQPKKPSPQKERLERSMVEADIG